MDPNAIAGLEIRDFRDGQRLPGARYFHLHARPGQIKRCRLASHNARRRIPSQEEQNRSNQDFLDERNISSGQKHYVFAFRPGLNVFFLKFTALQIIARSQLPPPFSAGRVRQITPLANPENR